MGSMSRPSTILSPGERQSRTPRHESTTLSNGRVPGRRLKRVALAASFLALPVLLSGCSTEWASMSPSLTAKKPATENVSLNTTPSPTATASAPTETTPEAEPTAAATTTSSSNPFAAGELAGGSAKHTLPVGDYDLAVSYWTDGTASSDVHLSATLKGADRKHAVKVTRFAASLDGSDGTDVPLADDQGEFVLTPPYSYTSALALPTSESKATATGTVTRTIDVRFDLLLETAPGSGAFYRQTVLDTVALNAADASDQGAAK